MNFFNNNCILLSVPKSNESLSRLNSGISLLQNKKSPFIVSIKCHILRTHIGEHVLVEGWPEPRKHRADYDEACSTEEKSIDPEMRETPRPLRLHPVL